MRPSRRHGISAVSLASTLCLAGVLALTGCSSSTTGGSITVAGSTTVLPIAEIAAEKYEESTGVHVLVSGLGSSAGIEAAINGTADIASSSRGLTADEASTTSSPRSSPTTESPSS